MDNIKTVKQSKNAKSSNAIFLMILVAMFSAIGAITSWISIPMPTGVPITLQTFGMALIGYTLGYKYGTLSVFIYVALGAIGVPVFSGFKGGLGSIIGVTGGFIIGFIIMAFICGLNRIMLVEKQKSTLKAVISIIFGILGIFICHICGILQFMLLTARGFWDSALLVSVPYLIKDIISVVAAYFVSMAALKLINKISRRKI